MIIVFRKGGQLPKYLTFHHNSIELFIVESFSYLGVVFTPGLEVIKLKHNDWLLADTCLQAANHCALS